jgi:hypothetical protein
VRRAFVDVATKSSDLSSEPFQFGSQGTDERFEFFAARVVLRHDIRMTQRRAVPVSSLLGANVCWSTPTEFVAEIL